MRLTHGMVAIAVVLAACGSSAGTSSSAPTSSAGTPSRCGPAAGHTLASDRAARVYSLHGSVYGCAVAVGKSFRLGSAARSIREGRVGALALAGPDAAYGFTTYGVDTVSTAVIVTRLRDGKQLRSGPATTRPLRPELFQSVDSIVVKDDGAVAWIASAGSVISGRATDTEVDRADRRGLRLLDSGPGIDQRSLRLHGSTVTWTDHGSKRSATLR